MSAPEVYATGSVWGTGAGHSTALVGGPRGVSINLTFGHIRLTAEKNRRLGPRQPGLRGPQVATGSGSGFAHLPPERVCGYNGNPRTDFDVIRSYIWRRLWLSHEGVPVMKKKWIVIGAAAMVVVVGSVGAVSVSYTHLTLPTSDLV